MIETVKENLCINRIVGSRTFNVTAQGDAIIPDTKPDILSTINVTGNVCIYKKEILEGKIRLDGNINIYLMYLADSENNRIRSFNTNLDFTDVLDFPGIDSKMILDEEVSIKDIECKILNGRKVNLRAILEVKADVFSNEKEELVREVKDIDDIQSQVRNIAMNSLVGQNTTKASAKETLIIDSTDELEEILGIEFNVLNKDTKISYNKVLAKADVEVRMMYLTETRRNKDTRRNYTSNGVHRFSGRIRRKCM